MGDFDVKLNINIIFNEHDWNILYSVNVFGVKFEIVCTYYI